MALTNAQMLAVIANGGSVRYRGSVISKGSLVPSDATIAANLVADDLADDAQMAPVTVSLSAAQIIAMFTTPVALLPAPGAGKCIIVDNITFKIVRTATAFTGGGVVEFRYTDGSGTLVAATLASTVVTGAAGTVFQNVRGIEASLAGTANAAIVITNATGVFAAGTGTATVDVRYHIV